MSAMVGSNTSHRSCGRCDWLGDSGHLRFSPLTSTAKPVRSRLLIGMEVRDKEVNPHGTPAHEQPTPAEFEILKILWDRDGPSTVRDVLEVVNRHTDPPRAYTSVMSLLNVMTDKGLFADRPRDGHFFTSPSRPGADPALAAGRDPRAGLQRLGQPPRRPPARPVRSLGQRARSDPLAPRRLPGSTGRHLREERRVVMRSLALEAFGGLTGRLIWLGLLNGLWLGLLAASACALTLRAAPRLSHRVRHTILLVAMLFVAIGPVVVTAVQHVVGTLPIRNEPAETESQLVVIAGLPSTELHLAPAPPRAPRRQPTRVHPRHLPIPEGALAHAVALALGIQPIVVPLWLLVVAALEIMLGLGAWHSSTLPECCSGTRDDQGSDTPTGPPLEVEENPAGVDPSRPRRTVSVWDVPAYDPIARAVDRRCHSRAAGCDPAHELAHARRLDPIVNLFQRLVETLLFFHPAVHWLSRSLRRERELCTDALAVCLTRNPLALAEALESVARLRLHFRSPTGLPIAGSSLGGERQTLLPRIQELIGMMPTRPRFPVWSFATLPVADSSPSSLRPPVWPRFRLLPQRVPGPHLPLLIR